MSNCGPDIVKYFIVTPLTGDTYVIGGVNTPATNNTNSALINLIYNQGIPFGTYSLPYTDVYVTGGTFSNDILSLRRNDGISIPITGFSSSPTTDVYVTGGTFSINTLTLRRNDGISIPITGFSSVIPPDVYVTGGTYSSGNLTLGRNDGVLISVSGFFTGSTDTYVTGGTYSSGNLTLNSQDNTITITGFTDYYTTGVTLNGNVLEFDRNDTNNAYSVDLSSIKFSGNTSGDCITDIYVSNLNSCSPLHIQNISSGDVLILENGNGFVGIGTSTPTETLDVNGNIKSSNIQATNGVNIGGYLSVIGNSTLNGPLNIKSLTGVSANFVITTGDDSYGVTNEVLNSVYTGYDSYNLTASEIGLNIVGDVNVPKALFINRNGDTSISGDLVVSGETNTSTLQVRDGASNNYVLRSLDNLGNAYWSQDGSVTGFTFDQINFDLTIGTNLGDYTQNLGILSSNLQVTGGTYDSQTGTATFYNNDGSYFSVTGFITGLTDTQVTAFTYTNENTFTIEETDGTVHSSTIDNLTGLNNLQSNTITASTNLYTSTIIGLSPLRIQPSGNVNTNHVYLRENGGSVGIGTTVIDSLAPEALIVSGRTLSYNIMNAKANVNNYAQINVVNKSSGNLSSSDVVATNDTGTESINYIDMGINGSNFSSGIVGTANDAYLYSTGRELYIGNATTGVNSNIKFFAGDAALNVDMIISGTTGHVGIGTTTPTERLDVSGKTKTVRLQVTNGAVNNYVLTSDSFGNASWSQNVDNYITGGTYSNGTITLNRQNGSVTINGLSTGYTLTSSGINTALGYTPLSAYTDTYVTGATYSNGTAVFTNNLGGSFNLAGLSTGYTLTSSGINTALGYTPLSAFTDTFITGITYSNNNIIVGRNQGQSSLTTNISTMTGLTVSGNLTVTGNTSLKSATATTLNISATPTTDTGTTSNYLTRDGSTGEVKVKTIPGPRVYGLFSQTGTSVTVSATTVESTLINDGIGTITVPANGFQVGDSFNGVLIGHLSCVGSSTLQIRIKTITGVLLADTGVIAMETATNKHWKLDVNFTIRQLGVAGIGSIASGGLFSYTKNSGTNFEGSNFSIINNTTFDTTVSNTLLVTAQWNTNNAGNSIYSEIFTLNKIY
jgi:hypothetical protein